MILEILKNCVSIWEVINRNIHRHIPLYFWISWISYDDIKKWGGKSIKNTSIKNDKGEFTINEEEIAAIIMSYYTQLYTNKSQNLSEMAV